MDRLQQASSRVSPKILSSALPLVLWLALSQSSTTHAANDVVIQENEQGFCSVEGNIENNNHGFTGSGFANTDNVSGSEIAWKIEVKYAGAYLLEWRYANGGSSNRSGMASVNNSTKKVSFPSTGDWNSWTSNSVSLNLAAGINKVVLAANTSAGLPNIDSFSVLGSHISAADCKRSSGATLAQDGNPVHKRYNKYKTEWGLNKADIILSHQYNNGGWPKNQSYDSAGKGGNGKGTFDNGATTLEMTYLARVYNETGNKKYRDAVRKAMDYTLDAQYPKGGWPQYYPLRGGYSDHVTFNDDAMSRILTMLYHVVEKNAPYDTDVITQKQRDRAKTAISKGVDYILKSQIVQNGKKTAWCAQHGKDDYKPKRARAYEHPSISGFESIEIIGFLMTQPQTKEIKQAVIAAINWFRSPDTYLADYTYKNSKFVPKSGSRVWYRFYDIPTGEPIFSNYDGVIHLGLKNQNKKKTGYAWGGNWGEKIIKYANKVGY